MSDKNSVILKRLVELIDNAGVPRQTIADEIGCDVSTVTKHYNGDRNITIDYVVKYAKYFNVSADYLLGLSGAKTSDKDIQFICDYTGLSNDTIGTLHYYSNYDNYISSVIDVLVTSEELSIIKDLHYDAISDNDYAQITKDWDESRKLFLITNIYNYLTSKELAADGVISIKLSGRVDNSTQKKIKMRNIFDDDEIARLPCNELIERILLDKIIDGLKKLKQIKDGDENGNNTQTKQ